MTPEERREIARQENNRYLREWRAKNPDKVRAINARYLAKKKKEAAEHEEERS